MWWTNTALSDEEQLWGNFWMLLRSVDLMELRGLLSFMLTIPLVIITFMKKMYR